MAQGEKIVKGLEVLNEFGIHARPAALIVKTASEFKAELLLEKEGSSVSARSIMGLLTLEGYKGCIITVTAKGTDAAEAVAALEKLFNDRFYEE